MEAPSPSQVVLCRRRGKRGVRSATGLRRGATGSGARGKDRNFRERTQEKPLLARACVIAMALVSPAWAGADDYPPGLFEQSPLNGAPADAPRSHKAQGAPKEPLGRRAPGGCHHYRSWFYPWPQPC